MMSLYEYQLYIKKPKLTMGEAVCCGVAWGHYSEGASKGVAATLRYNPRLCLRLRRPLVVAVFAFPILSWREACMFLQFYRLWRRLEFNTPRCRSMESLCMKFCTYDSYAVR